MNSEHTSPSSTSNVIGPIDTATWFCMRQCRESIADMKKKKEPVYDLQIKAETELLDHFMQSFLKKAA